MHAQPMAARTFSPTVLQGQRYGRFTELRSYTPSMSQAMRIPREFPAHLVATNKIGPKSAHNA